MLKGKKILIGICGGIAAYKIPSLIRLMIKYGAEVKVVMTKDAENFVTRQTLSVLSKNKVEEPFFDENGSWNNHVHLGLWPDIMLIAPATANTLAKMAHGICDNFLMATYLSSRCPVLIAPAMDEDMYHHFSSRESLEKLNNKGHWILSPTSGELASGLSGEGRMQEPENIFTAVLQVLKPAFKGKQVLISAGPTYEAIDPVRFIGNRSSGKTGIFLAETLALMGASVKLVLGPSEERINASGIKVIRVESGIQMHQVCMTEFPSTDIFIATAAVADFRPEMVSNQKIKKTSDQDVITLKLIKNPDILGDAGKLKKNNQLLIGFALETENQMKNAEQKLKNKNLDLIVINSPNKEGEGFGYNTNRVTLLDKDNKITTFELMHKRRLALEIATYISRYF